MNILITGGTTGMGFSLAQAYAKQGHAIGIISFQDQNELKDFPNTFKYFKADVTKIDELKNAFTEAHQTFGKIDLVIANAGVNMPKSPIPDTQKGRLVAMVNVVGVCNTFEAALPYFLEQKSGHFVAISSMSALNGLPGMSYYGASKAFVGSFCESLSLDLKKENIDVTCVYPGFVATDFVKNNKHKMPFLLKPEEAVAKIMDAIEKKKSHDFFPKIPYLFMNTLRRLPRPWYMYIMNKDILGLRDQEH